jgi:hypothetical protein
MTKKNNMKIFKLIIVFYTALSTVVMAQDNQILYCSDIAANGFDAAEKDGNYSSTGFTIRRYTVSLENMSAIEPVMNFKEGDLNYSYNCKKLPLDIGNAITCSNGYNNFVLNLATLNFTHTWGYGWALGLKSSIRISYGTCAKF